MSANIQVVKQLTVPYSTIELLGMMTFSLIIALLLISLGFRLIRTMSTIRKYDEACEKVKSIEAKLEEMKHFLATTELEYERDVMGLMKAHSKECSELQQIIFERNGEILNLKSKLLKYNVNSPL